MILTQTSYKYFLETLWKGLSIIGPTDGSKSPAPTGGDQGKPLWRECTRDIAAFLDDLILRLFREAGPCPQKVAFLALGSYGRNEICPYSDVDLLILSDTSLENKKFKSWIKNIFYPLWDGGFNLSALSHDLKTLASRLKSDFYLLTSLQSSRFLLGEESFFPRARNIAQKDFFSRKSYLRKNALRFLEIFRFSKGPLFLKEPHLKESTGYLRDILLGEWLFLYLGEDKLPDEFQNFKKEVLHLRTLLHLLRGHKQDTLDSQSQYDLIARETPDLSPSERLDFLEGFLRHHYLALERSLLEIYKTSRRVSENLRSFFFIPQRRKLLGKNLVLLGKDIYLKNPGEGTFHDVLEAYYHVAQGRGEISYSLFDWISSKVFAPEALGPEEGDTFLKILKTRRKVGKVLYHMHRSGVLGFLLPTYSKIHGWPQLNPYHAYTLDDHSFYTLKLLDELFISSSHDWAFYRVLYENLDSPHLLHLALLYHDVGKIKTGDHSRLGIPMAEEDTQFLALSKSEREILDWLILFHLKMNHISRRRDFREGEVVHQFAAQVGSEERLVLLTLLTYADIRGVGPGVLTGWMSALIEELYKNTQAVLKGQFREVSLKEVRQKIYALWTKERPAGILEEDLDRILGSFPHDLIRRSSAARLYEDLLFIHSVGEGDALFVRQESDTHLIKFTGRDRHGLFATLAALLYGNGFSIVQAELYPLAENHVYDLFRVSSYFKRDKNEKGEPRLMRDLDALLQGKYSAEEFVKQRTQKSFTQSLKLPIEIKDRVVISQDVHPARFLLEVRTVDRPGLLFHLAKLFSDFGCSIHVAKIVTEGPKVVDSFYMTKDGRAYLKEEEEKSLKEKILNTLKELRKNEG